MPGQQLGLRFDRHFLSTLDANPPVLLARLCVARRLRVDCRTLFATRAAICSVADLCHENASGRRIGRSLARLQFSGMPFGSTVLAGWHGLPTVAGRNLILPRGFCGGSSHCRVCRHGWCCGRLQRNRGGEDDPNVVAQRSVLVQGGDHGAGDASANGSESLLALECHPDSRRDAGANSTRTPVDERLTSVPSMFPGESRTPVMDRRSRAS